MPLYFAYGSNMDEAAMRPAARPLARWASPGSPATASW
jgi:hypothetical protein